MKNKLVYLILLFAMMSCNNYNDMITDWYYTSDEQESWLSDSIYSRFYMIDQNGITREFLLSTEDHYFLGGSSLFAGIKYHNSQREYYYQRYRSNYGDQYYFDIHASYENAITGGDFSFNLNELDFKFDYFYNEIVRIEIADTSKWLSLTSDGIEDSLFNSKIEFLDDFLLNDKLYSNVFHFQLSDFQDHWKATTITNVYYGQKVGLLKYELNNGLSFIRSSE